MLCWIPALLCCPFWFNSKLRPSTGACCFFNGLQTIPSQVLICAMMANHQCNLQTVKSNSSECVMILVMEYDREILFVECYRLVSNIRCTSNISCTPTLGNSQLEFSPTISLAQTSNTSSTPSFDSWVSIVDKVWSGPTWSELLLLAWDFDSPWITGPMTAHQSVACVRHIILAPAANLCTPSAIVFFPIKAWMWRHPSRYIDGSAILLTVKGPIWPRWPKISPCVTTKIMWNKTAFQ